MMNGTTGCAFAASGIMAMWLSGAPSASAGVIILPEPYAPPEQVVVYEGCPTPGQMPKLMPLLQRLQAVTNSSPAMVAASTPPVDATPVPVTRSIIGHRPMTIVGVGF